MGYWTVVTLSHFYYHFKISYQNLGLHFLEFSEILNWRKLEKHPVSSTTRVLTLIQHGLDITDSHGSWGHIQVWNTACSNSRNSRFRTSNTLLAKALHGYIINRNYDMQILQMWCFWQEYGLLIWFISSSSMKSHSIY